MKQVSGGPGLAAAYTYDDQGRLSTLVTDPGGALAATTTWEYSAERGWLKRKRYHNSELGPVYSYTGGGRLKTRARNGVTTTYTYQFEAGGAGGANKSDDPRTIAYSGGTAGVDLTHYRNGSVHTASRAGVTTTYQYNLAGQVEREAWAGGDLDQKSVRRTYDAYLRRVGLGLWNGETARFSTAYGYDPAKGRLETVSSGGSSASYSYLANGEAVREISLRNGQMPRLVNTWERDDLGRIRQAKAAAATGPSLSRAYAFDALNRRKEMALEDGSRWAYEYDGRGQVTEGKRYWSAGQSEPVVGQQFGYNHDAAGNRATVQAPGASTYTPAANRFNQYASRTVPQNLSVVGTANPSASVTVNGAAAARHGAYFQADVLAGNGTGPAWKEVTVQVSRQDPPGSASQIGHSLVPAASEAFVYDDEGNLTQDSVWQYEWDAENRLTGMTLKGMTPAPAAKRIEFQYDWQGRRTAKRVYDATTGGNQIAASVYVYDGWNLIGVLDGSGNLRQTFVWGLDVSGTERGAGGVGGLLWLTDGVGTAQERTAFCGYDASGNVIALVQATDPLLGARYEYGPFGEVIRMTGPLASANPFRFSTKYTDDETGLLYYGYRYYNPRDGRWLSRDPLGEAGGINLYAFCGNDPVNRIDPLGLAYGNPVLGPGGMWPSDPYAPGGDCYVPPAPPAGWGGAIGNGLDWGFGHSGGDTHYGPNSPQSQEMSQSSIAGQLRGYFQNKNKDKLCKDWVGVTNYKTHFRVFHEVISDMGNGTSEFVGDAAGEVSINGVDLVNCKVNARFKFTNTTSLTSLLYGRWPNSWNVTTPGRPFSNWTQTYEWDESFNCKCCTFKLLSIQ